VDGVDVLLRFGGRRSRVVVGRGRGIRELLVVGCGRRSHAVRGIDIFDRGHDVDGLVRDLTSWRGPSNCEDVVVVGFRLLVGDFRHD